MRLRRSEPRKRPSVRSNRVRSLVAAAIGIVAFVIAAELIFTKHIPFTHGYRVTAVFHSSNQLRKDSPVRIAGVDVGKVVGFQPGPGATREVVMELQSRGLPIHSDATMKIRPRLFLEGGYYVEVSPGTPSAPELEDGSTIPLSQTALPVSFTQVLSIFDTARRDSLKRLIDNTATGLGGGGAQALGRAIPPLVPALRDSTQVAQAARGTPPHELSGLIESSARVSSALADHSQQLADLVTNLSRTSGALASQDVALAASVRKIDAVMREAPGALRAVDGALGPLTRFSLALPPSLKLLPPVLQRTLPLLDQLDAIVAPGELPLLITRLRPTLVALPLVERRLEDLFGYVAPVARCTRDRIVPVLTSKLDDGPLSTGRPVWQELASGLVGLSSASQNFDANGPAARYLLGTGTQLVSTGKLPGLDSLLGKLLPTSGQLFGRSSGAPTISRPVWLGRGVAPPFRPDAPCADQAPPDLNARTGATAAETPSSARTARVRRLTAPALARAARAQAAANRKGGG